MKKFISVLGILNGFVLSSAHADMLEIKTASKFCTFAIQIDADFSVHYSCDGEKSKDVKEYYLQYMNPSMVVMQIPQVISGLTSEFSSKGFKRLDCSVFKDSDHSVAKGGNIYICNFAKKSHK